MMRFLPSVRRVLSGLALAVLLSVSTSAWVTAQNVTQGYQTDEVIQKGMIIGLDPQDGTKVKALTQNDAGNMLGVAVASTDSPVTLSNNTGEQQVYVATYGRYDVLVSDQNGAISIGDSVTISAITGVGMKADNTQELVVGKATAAYDGKQNVESTYTLNTSTGSKQVHIGRITVDISVAHNPKYQLQEAEHVPQFLNSAVKLLTDRPVSTSRIYASLAVLVITLFIASGILYAGVRSGMVAIGRNPLAKHAILRNLLQVTVMSLIVFVVGIFAVYLLLRI